MALLRRAALLAGRQFAPLLEADARSSVGLKPMRVMKIRCAYHISCEYVSVNCIWLGAFDLLLLTCACMRFAQDFVSMHGAPAETCTRLQSLQQLFSSSAVHSAKKTDTGGQAQPAGAAGSTQAPPEPQQPAANGGEQPGNGAAAEQEPPSIEGLQAELDSQRAASEGHAAEV